MDNIRRKIDSSLRKHPDYRRLENLSGDVWERVRSARKEDKTGFVIPLGFKVATLGLSLLAFVALSQVLLQANQYQSDIFDLRYFSYQSAPSLNLASVQTWEFTP
ncbi:hypothetical protein [Desulfosediminicola sp.]|uniref:hypothetical protein n=1 Tax=Desulfosediminicola sp. TaxID=2886825 RepID=UPI003AF24080